MAKQGISTGTTPNDGTGDTLLEGAVKINDNFDEVYNIIGDGSSTYVGIVTQLIAGNAVSLSTSFGSVTITGIAQTDNILADSLVVTGVTTVGVITSADSIEVTDVYATTLYGDGSNITGVVAEGSVGVSSDGFYVGAGFTQIDLAGGTDISVEVTGAGNIATVSYNYTGVADTSNVRSDSLVVTGVSTLGIITGATSLGVTDLYATTLYGDGSNLTGVGGGGSGIAIGIASSDADSITTVGTGITQINVVGAGYTVTVDSNVARLKNVAMALTDIVFTSAGFVTFTVGDQISYTATTNYTKSKFIVENRAGLAIGINYDTGGMGGGQNAPVGVYTATLRAGDLFGITEPFPLTITVEEAPPLNMNTLFSPPSSLVFYDNNDTGHAYVALASGGVVAQDGSYLVDRDGSIAGFSSDFGLYYNNNDENAMGWRFSSPNELDDVDSLNLFLSLPSINDGTVVTSRSILSSSSSVLGFATDYANMMGRTSGIGATSEGGKLLPVYDTDTRPLGLKYLKLTPDPGDGIFDNALTRVSGATTCAYGFTLEDPWLAHGCVPQLLAEESQSRWHLNAIGAMYSGDTKFDYIAYGNNSSGPFSNSSDMDDLNAFNGRVGAATSTVQVVWDPDAGSFGTYYYYIDGNLVGSSTNVGLYAPSSSSTDPVLSFGDVTYTNGGINIDGFFDYDLPTSWISRIRDFWFSNGGIDTTNITGVGTFRDRNVSDWSEYSNVDFYMTIDEVGVTTVKGNVTVAQGDITDGGTPLTRMF